MTGEEAREAGMLVDALSMVDAVLDETGPALGEDGNPVDDQLGIAMMDYRVCANEDRTIAFPVLLSDAMAIEVFGAMRGLILARLTALGVTP